MCPKVDVRIIISHAEVLPLIQDVIDYQLAADPNVPSTLFMLTGETHANRRRVWNRGFSNDSLKEYETDIAERATQLGEHLYKRHDKVVDLEKLLSFFTLVSFLFATGC